jgi:hypothetical protein
LWGEPASWPVEQTESLLRLHAQQGTGALVYPCVLGQDDIPSYARAHMKGVCVQNMQQQVQLRHTLEMAWKALNDAGIRPVLLKGAGLAACYPSPEQRAWGDIDIFVGKQQYHPACAVMRNTFPNALKFDEELDHYKHYNLIADGISIEIHRVSVGLQHPVDERRYERMEIYGMTHTQTLNLNGLEVSVPEPAFNALFVMMHAWEHMLSKGACVRQLCDLALLLHHNGTRIDAKRLKRWLKALHLMQVWELFTYILVNRLGLPRQKAFFYTDRVAQKADRLLADLLVGRMIAPSVPSQPAHRNRLARKWHTMKERLRNARRIQPYSPAYARHMYMETWLHGASRLFSKDRHWE